MRAQFYLVGLSRTKVKPFVKGWGLHRAAQVKLEVMSSRQAATVWCRNRFSFLSYEGHVSNDASHSEPSKNQPYVVCDSVGINLCLVLLRLAASPISIECFQSL